MGAQCNIYTDFVCMHIHSLRISNDCFHFVSVNINIFLEPASREIKNPSHVGEVAVMDTAPFKDPFSYPFRETTSYQDVIS